MADSYWLSDEGFIAPRAADFLTLIRDAYEEKTQLTIDWSADTFLGTITTVMADQLGGLGELSQSVYDAMDPNNATGLQLDNLALIVGVARNPASYSVCTVTCSGTVGAAITKGALVEGGGTDGHARWAATVDAVIGGGGTVDVLFQAQDAGAVQATTGTLITRVTILDGWDGATNAAPATPGEDRESDSALRKRRQISLQTAGSRSLNALRANVLALDGMQACVVVENQTLDTLVVDGISLAPISIGVVVYPNVLTVDQQKALATVLYEIVPFATATSGSEVATVTGADGVQHPMRWTYATTQAVAVAIVVVLKSGYELDDVQQPLVDAFAEYFLALGVGDAARILSGYALIATVEGVEAAALTYDGGATDIEPDATVLLLLSGTTVTT